MPHPSLICSRCIVYLFLINGIIPAARLGQKVIRGRKLGEVLALDGLTRTVIKAEGTGRIVKIRHRPSVQRGDAVCILAPI